MNDSGRTKEEELANFEEGMGNSLDSLEEALQDVPAGQRAELQQQIDDVRSRMQDLAESPGEDWEAEMEDIVAAYEEVAADIEMAMEGSD
jgi:phage-related protein